MTDAPKPPPATRLVLARHAVTAQTGPLLSGRAPGIDLSERGREQAEALGKRLADLPVAVVYASPIERTTQTAEAVAQHHGLTVRALPGVIEADYGEWTGGKLSDLAKTDLWKTVQRAPSRARFPGGESLAEMQLRMVSALELVVADHPGELVVVVSHADPIKAAIAHYTGVHLDLFQRIVVSPASVTVFELSAHGAAMLKCNDTGSLDELLPPPPADPETEADTEAATEPESAAGSRAGGGHRGAGRVTPEIIELDDVDGLGTGAVGEPGKRVFYIQARTENAQLTVLVEKEQVALLATESVAFLDRIADDYPELPFEVPAAQTQLREPTVPLFRARLIGLGFDPERELVLIELRERAADDDDDAETQVAEAVDEDDEPGYVARIYATRAQVRAMAARGAEAVSGGRPPCPLCELPMDPAGHRCPRWN